jgi:HK97 family phage portal protein
MATDIPQYRSDAVINLPEPAAKKASDYLNAYQGWSYAAINTIANMFAAVPLKLYKNITKKGGDTDVEEVKEHAALSSLYYVNDFMTIDLMKRMYVAYMCLLGEAAWAFIRKGKLIEQIWPLRPDWVSVIPSKDKFIDHYEYKPGGSDFKSVRIETEDLLFFKDFSPTNPYRGYGSVRAGAMPMDIDQFSSEWNRNFFFNSALPYLFLMTDKNVDQTTATRLLEGFYQKFGGTANAHKVALLTGGEWNIQEIGGKMHEMDFLETKKYVRDEILAIFGVSKANIGVVEDVNRANQEATDTRLMKSVVKPMLTTFVQYLTEFYLPNFDTTGALFFDFEDPVPEDVDMKLRIYESGLKYGWLTPNEVRDEEGYEPLEGGDTVYLPFGMKPTIGEVPEEDESPDTPQLDENDNPVPVADEEQQRFVRMVGKTPKKKLDLTVGPPPKRPMEILKDGIKQNIKHDLVKLVGALMKDKEYEEVQTEEEKQVLKEAKWKQLIARTDVWEDALRIQLIHLAEEQHRQILDELSKYSQPKSLKLAHQKMSGRDFAFSGRAENQRWYKDIEPYLERIIKAQGDQVLYDYGLMRNFDMEAQQVVSYLENLGYTFVKEVNSTTRSDVISTLSEGLRKGEGINELRDRVAAVYTDFMETRAALIARTEVLRAANFSANEAYRQSGIVVSKEWLTAADERTCPYCAEMDGKTIGVEEVYFDKGDTFETAGGKMDIKVSSVKYPPLHPRCRCTIVPVTRSMRRGQEHQHTSEQVNEVYKTVTKRLYEKEIARLEEKKVEVEKSITELEEKKGETKRDTKKEAEKIRMQAVWEAEEEKKKVLSEIQELRDNLREALYEQRGTEEAS